MTKGLNIDNTWKSENTKPNTSVKRGQHRFRIIEMKPGLLHNLQKFGFDYFIRKLLRRLPSRQDLKKKCSYDNLSSRRWKK